MKHKITFRKIIACATAVALVSSIIPDTGLHIENIKIHAASQVVGELSYEVESSSGVKVVGLSDASATTDLVIPANVIIDEKEYSVVSIGERAFYGNTTLASITIPASVKEIKKEAFANCSGLTEVSYPEGNNVEKLGVAAFAGCQELTGIEIGKNLTEVEEKESWESDVFEGCSKLGEVILEEGMEKIPAYLFQSCSGIKTIEIPSSVKEIGKEAFANCSGLTEPPSSSSNSTPRNSSFSFP